MIEDTVVVLCESGIILGLFNDEKIIESDGYERYNNKLLIKNKNSIYFYDIVSGVKGETFQFNDIKIMKINGEDSAGILTYDKKLYLIRNNKIIKELQDVEQFIYSGKYLSTQYKGELTFYHENNNILTLKNVNEFYQFNDILITLQKKKTISIYKDKKMVFTKEFKNIEGLECKINNKENKIMLLLTTEYVDNNYFGTKELYLYFLDENKFRFLDYKIVNDYQFLDDKYVICYGHQPSKIVICQNRIKEEYPSGFRNRVYYNSNMKMVCFCGMDNLSGNIEIFDCTKRDTIFKTKMLGVSEIMWSPSGTYLCTAVTNILKVDNKIVIYDYYGRKIAEREFKNLERVDWVGNSTFKKLEEPKVKNLEQEEVYIPPNRRGRIEKKVKTHKPIKKQVKVENTEELKEKIQIIEILKKKIQNNEKLSLEEMNLVLKESDIKKKLDKK
ncbi:Eukaryotic translation initiation factor eIF2A [Spraguea lophii 42_110]|uniref:Eukaryotic translation initiation factor eIF2A n=1 Tax=Spraguea lophii (strain 42_110) TaxID=1358809 RepID=S7XVQ6_SPRLO|nr:Eukaryotic translation initiation factor eIF2A [Spraguea lophii 42_110]